MVFAPLIKLHYCTEWLTLRLTAFLRGKIDYLHMIPVHPTYIKVKLHMHNVYMKYMLFNLIILPADAGMNGTTLTTPGACHKHNTSSTQSPLPAQDNHKETHIQLTSPPVYLSIWSSVFEMTYLKKKQ